MSRKDDDDEGSFASYSDEPLGGCVRNARTVLI
jgi:hypothetical protein